MIFLRRLCSVILFVFWLLTCESAFAAKARSIASVADSAYHAEHLRNHLGETTCHGTGNYIKTRNKANGNKVIGHLEQADEFILLDVKNGWAQIEVVYSDKTSPDSWEGMTGWVNSDYIDCNCTPELYFSNSTLSSTLSHPFPVGMPDRWSHLSGAGAWSTELTINQDGSFYGYYHDADMGDIGDGYPNGTLYESMFQGEFAEIKQINSFSYSMIVSELNINGQVDSQFIQDDVLHIITAPAGISKGSTFLIYVPGTPLSHLSEEHLSWLHDFTNNPTQRYALCNLTTGAAFDSTYE